MQTQTFGNVKELQHSQRHSFHILGPSPFPALVSFSLLFWLIPQIFYLHDNSQHLALKTDFMHVSILCFLITVMFWFFAIINESKQGFHTKKVQKGLRLGMLLFIVSEIMFFFAFFWAFFHYSLVPSIATGATWPPVGTQEIDPWGLPLVNTVLLLSSGVTVTIAHAQIVKNHMSSFLWHLFLTALLGIVFLSCQYYEYTYGIKFSWRDNIFGSIFFITTGFHGFHVTIGTLFLIFCWARQIFSETKQRARQIAVYLKNKLSTSNFLQGIPLVKRLGSFRGEQTLWENWGFTRTHHFGFEAAAWYWHFVDVVWMFLFLTIYWWGNK